MEKLNKDKPHSKNNNNQPKMEKQSSLEQSEKQRKSSRSKRKPDSERDKQKAEYENSKDELKKLLAQFGTKAKVSDDIDKDTTAIRSNITELMTKAKSKSLNNNNTKSAAPHQFNETATTPTTSAPLFSIILNNLMSLIALIIRPIQVLYQTYENLYCSINWYLFLTCILLLELSIIGLIWKVKRVQYSYMYIEPYEAVVHGTFGVETTSWTYLNSIVDILSDFFGELKHGGHGFGSPSYDGLVPI